MTPILLQIITPSHPVVMPTEHQPSSFAGLPGRLVLCTQAASEYLDRETRQEADHVCRRLAIIRRAAPVDLDSLFFMIFPGGGCPCQRRQHVGKTTASLGIISGLKKRFDNVGFIKPVGQQHERTDGGILVDKARKKSG